MPWVSLGEVPRVPVCTVSVEPRYAGCPGFGTLPGFTSGSKVSLVPSCSANQPNRFAGSAACVLSKQCLANTGRTWAPLLEKQMLLLATEQCALVGSGGLAGGWEGVEGVGLGAAGARAGSRELREERSQGDLELVSVCLVITLRCLSARNVLPQPPITCPPAHSPRRPPVSCPGQPRGGATDVC